MEGRINKSKNKISWFAIFTGANLEILDKCSGTCRNVFKYIGMTMLFTAIISATIVGYAVSIYAVKSPIIYPVIFTIWAIFIYLFERMIVLTDSTFTRWIRVGAILVLALFHSFIWDTLTLKDDILTQMNREYNIQIAAVNAKYEGIIKSIEKKIDTNVHNIDDLNSNTRSYIDSLQAEGRNFGGSRRYGIGIVYKNLENLKEEYKTLTKSEITSKNKIIRELQNKIYNLKKDQIKEINTIVKPNESGLMEQIKIMHKIVFTQGTITEILFFIIWFCLFCFLESLPVLSRVVFDKRMEEYFIGQNLEQENSVSALKARKLDDWTVIQTEMQFNLQSRLSISAYNSFLNNVEMEKHSIKSRLEILEEFLNELDIIENDLKKTYSGQYEDYIKPEIEKAINDFFKSMKLNT